jgi:hypothetical protein
MAPSTRTAVTCRECQAPIHGGAVAHLPDGVVCADCYQSLLRQWFLKGRDEASLAQPAPKQ